MFAATVPGSDKIVVLTRSVPVSDRIAVTCILNGRTVTAEVETTS